MGTTQSMAQDRSHARASGFAWPILWIGLIAGTLDISENLILNSFRNVTPGMVFHFIAAGLVGRQTSAQMGSGGFALGVVIHFCIALTWTAIFYLAATRIGFLTRQATLCGLIYGVIVFLVMNFIVLPLTKVAPHGTPTLWQRFNALLPLLFCIGLTIALLTKWDLRRKNAIL